MPRTDPVTWIGVVEAARLLNVSRATVQRSLLDPEARAKQWGAEHEGWRFKPLARRKIFQVAQERVDQLADPGTDEAGAGVTG